MLNAIKRHFSKAYNVAFWILFAPGMFITLSGVYELYTKYYDELTKQDHMQFFLRFFFPISLHTPQHCLTEGSRRSRKLNSWFHIPYENYRNYQ
jgi:hypothetical protein